MTISRRGFFGIIGAALVAPKASTSCTIYFNPPIHRSLHDVMVVHHAFDNMLVGMSKSYHVQLANAGLLADRVFPIIEKSSASS